VAALYVSIAIGAGKLIADILAPTLPTLLATAPSTGLSDGARFAGELLLLQLGALLLAFVFPWPGAPLTEANLGSIVDLQRAWSPQRVARCLNTWRDRLASPWTNDAEPGSLASRAMREVLRRSLWRDLLGLIPVYFAVLTIGMWFAGEQLNWSWLKLCLLGLPSWLAVPAIAALADYAEDACHLAYLRKHELGKNPGAVLTGFSFFMSAIKVAAFGVSSVVLLAAIAQGSWWIETDRLPATGWRGSLVLLITATALGVFALTGLLALKWLGLHKKRRLARDAQAEEQDTMAE